MALTQQEGEIKLAAIVSDQCNFRTAMFEACGRQLVCGGVTVIHIDQLQMLDEIKHAGKRIAKPGTLAEIFVVNAMDVWTRF